MTFLPSSHRMTSPGDHFLEGRTNLQIIYLLGVATHLSKRTAKKPPVQSVLSNTTMKTKRYFVFLLMCFALVAHVLAAMRELTEPGLGFPDSFPAPARAKVEAVLQRPDCKFLGGFWLNSFTSLRYEGETVPLNLFLESLAECPGITLSIRFDNHSMKANCDWVVTQEPGDPTRLCVRINLNSSRVKLEDLVVPEMKAPIQ